MGGVSSSAKETGQQIKESAGKAVSEMTGGKVCGHTPEHKQYTLPPKSPQLNDRDFAYLTEQTGKSKDDIQGIFRKFGLDREGAKLNKQDYINFYQALHPESPEYVNDVADRVYRAFDADCSGYINLSECMVGYALTSKFDTRRKLEYAFDLYDVNHTGTLNWSEVRSVVTGKIF